jgi:small subunit ribosomal protein S6
MSAHRQYELVYLLPAESSEQDVADLQTHIEQILGRFSAVIDKTEAWGRRKLAYEIGPHKEAIYVLHQLTGPAELIRELDRRLKVNDKVIRHLVVRVDEENRVADRRRAERTAHIRERRVARGLSPEPEPTAPEAAPGQDSMEEVEG